MSMSRDALINSLRTEFERVDKREEEMRRAGSLLANCAYNLAQRPHLTEAERRTLDESRRAWDAVVKNYPRAAA